MLRDLLLVYILEFVQFGVKRGLLDANYFVDVVVLARMGPFGQCADKAAALVQVAWTTPIWSRLNHH